MERYILLCNGTSLQKKTKLGKYQKIFQITLQSSRRNVYSNSSWKNVSGTSRLTSSSQVKITMLTASKEGISTDRKQDGLPPNLSKLASCLEERYSKRAKHHQHISGITCTSIEQADQHKLVKQRSRESVWLVRAMVLEQRHKV